MSRSGAEIFGEFEMLRFYNTLSGQLEEFRPLREGEVRIYFCGPTVWDYAQRVTASHT
jgi:hypothetical protein